MTPAPRIGIVDDEPDLVKALARLLSAEGYLVSPFASAAEFLALCLSDPVDCLILDVSMPALSGLDLQAELTRRGIQTPVIFLTGQGSIPMTVQAIQAGAVNFLTKPVDDVELLTAIRTALDLATRLRRKAEEDSNLASCLARLTPRELEVLRHVIAGKPNKQIAADLGTREQTIKVHRMRITEKLNRRSVAEWVRFAARLGVEPAP